MLAYSKITSVYVDKSGASCYSPSFTNIKGALEYVVKLRSEGAMQPLSIRLCDVEYDIDEPIHINADMFDVTIEPLHGRTLISGGRRIRGFVRDTFNSVECFSAPVGETADFTDFYVDGRRASLTRWPETGFFTAHEFEEMNSALFAGSRWFIADKDSAAPVASSGFEGVICSFCHFWIDEHSPVESYDAETGRLVLKYRSCFTMNGEFGSSGGLDYYFENVANAFGRKNEFYLDRKAKRVYYIPRDVSQTPDSIVAYAPVTQKLLVIEGTPGNKARGVRFRNIDFAYTRGEYAATGKTSGESGERYASDPQAVCNAHGAIEFAYAHYCSLESCSIRCFGVHAVNIKHGCDKIRVLRSEMTDGGAGGVKINGAASAADTANLTHNVTVEDCLIAECGRRYMAACGILIMHSFENRIAHNEIRDLFYTGISVGWVWGYGDSVSRDNAIVCNYIHNLGKGALSDMGGVYLLGKQPGTHVAHNVIHDVKSRTYGGWALYTDEGSSYITLENNICYNTSDNVYHQHYGSFNTVRNNVFAFAGEADLRVSRPEDHLSISFERNIILTDGEPVWRLEKAHLDNSTVGSRDNLIMTRGAKDPEWLRGSDGGIGYMRAHGMEEGDLVAAMPNDITPDNVTADKLAALTNTAYASALGITPIDTRKAGIRK